MTDRRRHADRDREAFAQLMREVEGRTGELESFAGRKLTADDRADILEFVRRNISGGAKADAISWLRKSFIDEGRAA